jgi:hypothetical protein
VSASGGAGKGLLRRRPQGVAGDGDDGLVDEPRVAQGIAVRRGVS